MTDTSRHIQNQAYPSRVNRLWVLSLDPSIPPQATAFAMRGVDDLGLLATPLSNFRHWHIWDVQRLDGEYHKEYVDATTIYLGIYGAAAGIPEDMMQEIQNDYALLNSTFRGQIKSDTYGAIAQANVQNIHIGYETFRANKR